ncbi:MAG TPA: hypothetical protein VFU73_04115 [Actinocrinis sp.]|nr:hypothetical protein [Actinocrinis sp.]
MKETTETDGAGRVRGGRRVQITKRRGERREPPPLDLRSPSGKRTLPY